MPPGVWRRDGSQFVNDWLGVAADEAMHFALIQRHLATMGAAYGDLPAHDGWQAAQETAHDVAARLAVVPMVLEARGLDVTPATLDACARRAMSAARAFWNAFWPTRSAMCALAPRILAQLPENGRIVRFLENPGHPPLSGALSHRSTTRRAKLPVCRAKPMRRLHRW
jgi:hypothetical protein